MKPETTVPSEVSPSPPAQRDTVLIIDDLVANTEVLLAALADTYDVSVIPDGPTALAALATVKPDLILLDIMMPGMDGFEVCTRLQANPDTRDIPVIFLTAMAEDNDEEKGLNLGAVDYITKPFNPALVKARVRNHLALRHARIEVMRQRDQVEVALQKLRKLEQQRDDLVHMIVHDLRGPLTGMMGYLDLLAEEKANTPDFAKYLLAAQKSTKALCDIVSALLDISRLETGLMPLQRTASDVGQLTQLALERLGLLTQGRRILIRLPAHPALVYGNPAHTGQLGESRQHIPEDLIMAHCDPTITQRILQNLLDNALKFTPSEGCIQITIVPEESCVCLSIADTGPGIAAEYHEKVFQKFCQVETRTIGSRRSTGLGLAFCKLAAEAQDGSIQLESELGHGATFHLRLPLAASKAKG